MKYLYTILLGLGSIGINSQSSFEDSLFQVIRDQYDALSHEEMETDLLFNRGFILMNDLEEWNNGAPVVTNYNRWKFFYNAIEPSDIEGETELPPVENLDSINEINDSEIPEIGIAVLNYYGDYITIEEMNELVNDNEEEDPDYDQMNFFSGTVTYHESLNKTVHFSWSPHNYFSNIEEDQQLYVDFSDGVGYRELSLEDPEIIAVTYESIGEKNIIFKLMPEDDDHDDDDEEEEDEDDDHEPDYILSYSKINILAIKEIVATEKGEIIIYDTAQFDTTQNRAYTPISSNGVNGTIIGNYFYKVGVDGVLDKPFIVCEGFDFLGGKSPEKLFNEWEEDNRIEPLLNHGYDLFFVSYKSPSSKLQKNAKVLEELIKMINGMKEGHFEGILVGESMSGILGRIALKNLENQGYDHEIGLYLPFDSPLGGANIPKGLQWVVNDFYLAFPTLAGISAHTEAIEAVIGADMAFVDLYHQLLSNAARQMIVRHILGNSMHENAQDYLANLGYPENLRKVSFVNGSDNGTQSPVGYGSLILPPITLLSGIFGIHMQAWHSKTNVNNQLVSFIQVNKIVTTGIPVVAQWIRRSSFDGLPYDYAPGSYVAKDGFTFVPSLNAFDIKRSYITGTLDYFHKNKAQIIADGLTPFDDFYANSENKGHTHFEGFYNVMARQEYMYDTMCLQNRIITKDRDFEARNIIVVGQDVQKAEYLTHIGNNSLNKQIENKPFIINSNAKVNFAAGEEVIFETGFIVPIGSECYTTVEGIDPTIHEKEEFPFPKIIEITENESRKFYQTETMEHCSWNLVGNETNESFYGISYVPPVNLPTGRYTLFCSRNGKTKSKIIDIKTMKAVHVSVLEENPSIDVKIYPNPINNEVIISSKYVIKKVIIRDVNGVIISQKTCNTNRYAENLIGCADGIYTIEIETNKGKRIQKIIKQ